MGSWWQMPLRRNGHCAALQAPLEMALFRTVAARLPGFQAHPPIFSSLVHSLSRPRHLEYVSSPAVQIQTDHQTRPETKALEPARHGSSRVREGEGVVQSGARTHQQGSAKSIDDAAPGSKLDAMACVWRCPEVTGSPASELCVMVVQLVVGTSAATDETVEWIEANVIKFEQRSLRIVQSTYEMKRFISVQEIPQLPAVAHEAEELALRHCSAANDQREIA
ncbi:hypothetical protein B7463_g9087, partial [Scytalidium lignicola]